MCFHHPPPPKRKLRYYLYIELLSSIYFLSFLLLLSLFTLLHLLCLLRYMMTPLHSLQFSECLHGAWLSCAWLQGNHSFFRRLIRKKILVLYSIKYCIWLCTLVLKSGRFCELRCVCRFGQFACAYGSVTWLSSKVWICLLHSHNSMLDCGILYSGICFSCFVCHWEWLLKTCPNVFAMTCAEGSARARSLWGSWTVVSAVLWQSFSVQPPSCADCLNTCIVSDGLFTISVI